jgi:hypothetical protein
MLVKFDTSTINIPNYIGIKATWIEERELPPMVENDELIAVYRYRPAHWQYECFAIDNIDSCEIDGLNYIIPMRNGNQTIFPVMPKYKTKTINELIGYDMVIQTKILVPRKM